MTATTLILDASPVNPDMVGITSNDPAAAASFCKLKTIPPVGTWMVLRIASALSGQVDIGHTVTVGDTPNTVAYAFSQEVLAQPALSAHNISSQYTPASNIFGVTNHLDNIAYVTPLNFHEHWAIQSGGPYLDAGPVAFLARLPDGVVPPNGSNIGQFMIVSTKLGFPGVPCVQYGMVGVNIINNDDTLGGPGLMGEWSFYTPGPDHPTVKRIAWCHGVSIGKAADMGPDTLNTNELYLAGRRVTVRPDGTLQLE